MLETQVLPIQLNRPQALAHRCLAPGNSVNLAWGRGIGKSRFERWNGWYEQVAKWDGVPRPTTGGHYIAGIRIVLVMPTFKSCRDVHEQATRAEIEGDGPWAFLKPKVDHTRWLISFPGGSWIQWFGAKDANSKRGIRCDAATFDECDDIDPEVVDAVSDPWFSEPWSLRQKLFAGTPRRGRYGLLFRQHKLGLDGEAARRMTADQLAALPEDDQRAKRELQRHYTVHATWRDAPETVGADYVAGIRARLIESGRKAVYEREWECNFDSAEGLVYPMWDESVHVQEPPAGTQFTEILVGVDHGWEDPGVMLVVGVAGSGRDATLYVLEEVYESYQLESWWIEQAKRIRAKYARCRQMWFADPSRPDRVKAIAAGAGVRFSDTNNAIEDGVSAVADRLAVRPDPEDPTGERRFSRLYVSPSCRFLRWEMVNYRRRRDPSNPDRFLDQIEDKNNHCLVAGTSVLTDRGGVPIEDVRIGDCVLTRDGFKPVLWSGMTFQRAETFAVRLSNGATLEGTGDHPVWTKNRGWVRLDALRYGDILLGCDEICQSSPKMSFSTASSTDATRSRHASNCGGRLLDAPLLVVSCSPTGRSAQVYDLTVDDAHEFFANGVLVHNSMDSLRYLTFSRFGLPIVYRSAVLPPA